MFFETPTPQIDYPASPKSPESIKMKKRIYGLETEYALIFNPHPQDSKANKGRGRNGGDSRPENMEIFEAIRNSVRKIYNVVDANYRKPGVFLENGALLHYEAQIEYISQGLIEAATPECSDPKEAALYSRAQDMILETSVSAAERELRRKGYRGKIIVGKNCTDPDGNSYGCHENYLVEDKHGKAKSFMMKLVLWLFLAASIPFWVAIIALFLSLLVILTFVSSLYMLLSLSTVVPILNRLTKLAFEQAHKLADSFQSELEQFLARFLGTCFHVILRPLIASYSLFCKHLVFTKFIRELTPFLVTRQIFCGAGHLNFNGYSMSQRASAIKSVCRIFWDDSNKPIYDIKEFVISGRSILKDKRRLHLLLGDSNMSQFSEYLKIGVTGLMLDMIEDGAFGLDMRLKSPVKALKSIARDLTCGEKVQLKNGAQMSPLEIQRVYLERAKQYCASKPADETAHDIIGKWEYVLDRLDDSPKPKDFPAEDSRLWKHETRFQLDEEVDWVIKKRLLDNALLQKSDWSLLLCWLPIIQEVERRNTDLASALAASEGPHRDRLKLALKEKDFRALDRRIAGAELDWEDLKLHYDLYYQMKKIDLKYHDISTGSGYFQCLSDSDAVKEIFSSEEIEKAISIPPQKTRARLRGEAVRSACENKEAVRVGWSKIKYLASKKTVVLDDEIEDEPPS